MVLENLFVPVLAFGFLAIKGIVSFAIVYAGARLAIRHERRIPN